MTGMTDQPPDTPPSPSLRPGGRTADELRPVSIQTGPLKYAEGSVLIEMGDTQVLVAASVQGGVPPFLRDKGEGWVTAEYSMLPRSTVTRNRREVSRGRPSGRTAEIQRLIGRSLRAVFDRTALGERTIIVDCDVIQADGGTRTASITGAWVASYLACAHLLLSGEIEKWPLTDQLAAVSVGLYEGAPILDLEYVEDVAATVDMNVVGTAEGGLVEIQGTGEDHVFDRGQHDAMLDLALAGIYELASYQDDAVESVKNDVESVLNRGSREPAPAKSEDELWGAP